MRPGFGQFNVATPEFLQFAAQFGATDVLLNTPLLPGASAGSCTTWSSCD